MSGDRLEFHGVRGHAQAGQETAQVSVAAEDEWVYCELVGRTIQIWSGPKCKRCEVGAEGLKRCALHHNAQWIASQLELASISAT